MQEINRLKFINIFDIQRQISIIHCSDIGIFIYRVNKHTRLQLYHLNFHSTYRIRYCVAYQIFSILTVCHSKL